MHFCNVMEVCGCVVCGCVSVWAYLTYIIITIIISGIPAPGKSGLQCIERMDLIGSVLNNWHACSCGLDVHYKSMSVYLN